MGREFTVMVVEVLGAAKSGFSKLQGLKSCPETQAIFRRMKSIIIYWPRVCVDVK